METRRKPPPWQWGLLIAIMAACFMVYLDTAFRQFELLAPPNTREDLLAVGTLSEDHKDFVEGIGKELKVTKKIEVIMIPTMFFTIARGGRLVQTETSWLVLIERDFFLRLNIEEQKALIGHELGHIIFIFPRCVFYMSCQKGADRFAALHTSPDATIGFLNKLFNSTTDEKRKKEHESRVQYIERLKQGKSLPSR